MDFKLFKISGYEDAIMSLRMSKGKFYSYDKARDIQELVWLMTDPQGFVCKEYTYYTKRPMITKTNKKVTGFYEKDLAEFTRLLELTFNNAMKDHKHHTLMKYIDVTFFTEDLHRGAQDDLDAHAIAFNNRITRFSTRLAEIDSNELSEWYKDKIIPFDDAIKMINEKDKSYSGGTHQIVLPEFIAFDEYEEDPEKVFRKTPFGYVLEKYAQVPAKNGLAKDVQRGGMLIGMSSNAIWKTDIFNLRYIYKMRSKLTKANPELKNGMEILADQIERLIPVFGPYFRKEYTDSKVWEHVNKVKTISSDEYEEYKKLKRDRAQMEINQKY